MWCWWCKYYIGVGGVSITCVGGVNITCGVGAVNITLVLVV